ncbi:MAG: toluene-4-monooxygenase system B family protein [Gammaproteobacteria bacterium]
MSALPLVCNFEDGCILTLVTVDTEFTMDQVAAEVAEHFVGRMLPIKTERTMRVRKQDTEKPLPRTLTVQQAGWVSLETIEIFYE